MTLAQYEKVCLDTKLHITVERRDGSYVLFTVDYHEPDHEKAYIAFEELKKFAKAKVHFAHALGPWEVDVTAKE